jgi:leader peptidase (prepilin peptidase)/N-methyltransferase
MIPALLLLIVAPFVGSFLGAVIERWPRQMPILLGRSICFACRRVLAPRDLVPLLSWALARGRCRYCAAELGWFHPAIELAALGIAVWSIAVVPGWLAVPSCLLGWLLLALAVIDQRAGYLPDILTLPLALIGLVATYAIDPAALLHHVIGMVGGSLLMYAVAAGYRWLRGKEGLGGGDIKLFGALGAWLGWQGLPALLIFATLSGMLWALLSLGLRGRLKLDSQVPFGPHLCLGGWLVWLYGPLVPV